MIGNRVTEKDVRNWLNQHGYFGRSAIFYELELHAIKRPGWLQIFRFHAKTKKEDGEWCELFGAVRDDERERTLEQRTQVAVFDSAQSRQQQLDDWSEDLIQLRERGESGSSGWVLLIAGALFLVLLVLWLMKQ